MITREHFRDDIYIQYYQDNTKVTNSYKLTDEEIKKISSQIAFARNVKYDWKCIHKRKAGSYIKEIKGHNNLYKLGLYKSHTIDTDLEENQSILNKIIWWLIGR